MAGAVALFAACGSSYKGLSKADFISQADAICTKYNGLSVKATSGLKNPTDAQLLAAIQAKVVPLLPKLQAELRALKPPKADRATVKQFLAALQQSSTYFAQNTAAIVKTKGVNPYSGPAQQDSSAYGFKVCAGG